MESINTTRNMSLIASAIKFLKTRIIGKKLTLMTVAVVLMIVVGWVTNQPAILLGEVLDNVIVGTANTFSDVTQIIGLIALIFLFKEAVTWVRKYLVEKVATEVERDEFVALFKHILSCEIGSLGNEQSGALIIRVHRSIEGVIKLLKVVFLQFFPVVIVSVIAIVIAANKNILVALVMIGVAMLGVWLTVLQVKSQKGIRIELFRAKEEIGGRVVELKTGIEYVRAAGTAEHEIKKMDDLANRMQRKEFIHHKWMMSFDAAKQLLEGLGFVLTIAVGAYLASIGQVSKGDVLTFTILFGSMSAPLKELHKILDEGFESVLKIADLENIYARPRDKGLDGTLPPRSDMLQMPLVVAKKLSVGYSNREGGKTFVLDDISVSINIGETVGVVGPSGSGKTTFIKAILGIIPEYEGSLEIFGDEILNIDKSKLAEKIAYVSQQPYLFSGTIRENIAYGNNAAFVTDDQLISALHDAQLSSLVTRLEANVEEAGRNFAGGEKQRLSLARLFSKENVELYILDEPTAALDYISETQIQSILEQRTRKSTSITIAHRLNTLKNVDRILVFSGGKLVQNGSYDELEKTDGVFRELLSMHSGVIT